MHYNNGAVWPFVTGFVIWGQYNYRRPWSGYPLIDALKQMTFDWARGRHPELLSGRYYRPLDTAVPQQFFATSMLVSPTVMGVLGWEPDAPNRAARLAPQIPPHWDRVTVRNLKVGATTLDVQIEQAQGQLDMHVTRRGPPIDLTLVGSFPPGIQSFSHSGNAPGVTSQDSAPPQLSAHPRGLVIESAARLEAVELSFNLRWTGGLSVAPPTVALEPGQRSRGIRVLEFRSAGRPSQGEWSLSVEGEGGRTYYLDLFGETVDHVEGARVVAADGTRTTIEIQMSRHAGRTTQTIRLFGIR
jgi:hypothetical protein